MPGQEDSLRVINLAQSKEDIAQLIEALGPLKEEIKSFAGLAIGSKNTGDGAEFKAQATQIAEALTRIKTLEGELEALRIKNAGANKTRTDQEIRDQLAVTRATQERVKTIKAEGDAYQQLVLAANRASVEFKKLAAEFGNNSAQANRAREEVMKYRNEINEINESIGSHQANVGNYLQSIKGFFGELFQQLLLFVGLYQAIDFLKDSIKEFQHAQEEANKLNNILRNIGREDALGRLKDKAHALAQEFEFLKEEDITAVFDKLIVYGKLTEKQITDLLPVIINFSAQTGKSLDESTSLIEKALEGNARGLKEFGINIDKGGSAAENLGIIMTQLAPKVKGAAEAFGKDFKGSMQETEVEIDEVKKKIGEELEPAVKGFYSAVAYVAEGASGLFSDIGKKASEAADTIKTLFLYIRAASTGDYADALLHKTQKAIENQEAFVKSYINANKGVNEQLAKFYLAGDKFDTLNKEAQTTKLQAYQRNAEQAQRFLEEAKRSGILENIEKMTNRVAVAQEILSQAKSLMGPLGIGDDKEAGGRESLTAQIKAEAEARIKLLEIKQKDRIEEIEAETQSSGSPTATKLNGLKHISEIETDMIKKRLAIQMQANSLELADLKASYDAQVAAKGVNAEKKKFLSDKYALEEKTLISQRAQQQLEADDAIFQKQLEYHARISKINYDARHADLNAEIETNAALLKLREDLLKKQEELIKRQADLSRNSIAEDRDMQLARLEAQHTKDNPNGEKLDELKKYNDKKRQIIEEAADYTLKADLQELQRQKDIAVEKNKLNEGKNAGLSPDKQVAPIDVTKYDAEIAKKKLEIEQNKDKGVVDSAKEAAAAKTKLQNKEIEAAKEVQKTVEEFVKAGYERQLNAIQGQIDANNRLKEVETRNIESSTANAQQRAAQLIELNAKTAAQNQALQRQQRDVKIKEAEFDKGESILHVVENTAVAISKAVAEFPLTAGEPWAGIAAGEGAAQVAAILARPIPKYETGRKGGPAEYAIVHPGEMIVNESGKLTMTPDRPALTFLERNAVVHTADEVRTMQMNSILSRSEVMQENKIEQKLDKLTSTLERTSREQIKAMTRKEPPQPPPVSLDFLIHAINSCK